MYNFSVTLIYYFGTALFAVLIGFVLNLFVRLDDKRFRDVSRKIPGPPRLPFFGNTFQFIVSPEQLLSLFDKWVGDYGHRFIYRVGTYWIVGLSNPRDIEKLLTSTVETVKSGDYDQLIPWLGTGLLISNGEKWTKRRKLLTPAFHFKILERFIHVFNSQSFTFVDIVKRKYNAGIEEFDVCPLISKMTLDIICETAMGAKVRAQEQDEEDSNTGDGATSSYISGIVRIKHLQQHRAFRPWLESEIIWDLFSYGREEKKLIEKLHTFTKNIIQQRKREYLDGFSKSNMDGHEQSENQNESNEPDDIIGSKRKPTAFLDLLLEAQHSGDLESDEDVREETDTFMFEGHDTVSSGIAFTLFLLGRNEVVQEKVYEELYSVFGNDKSRPVTMEDLGKLKYLGCCVKESLRLFPSVPIMARNIENDFELDDEVILPRDTLVVILPYQLHRNSEVYKDPLEFQPERFLHHHERNSSGGGGGGERKDPFAFIPFSAGPRNCIGQKFALMEEKIVIANILRKVRIESVQKLEELTLLADLVLHSKDGLN